MMRRIAVRGMVVRDDGTLLCVRLKAYKDHLKRDNSYWCLPGGKLEAGESILDGLHREMLEETGIAPHIGNLLYVQQFNHSGTDCMELFFHITNTADYAQIDLSKTSHGNIEIEAIEFIHPAEMHVLPTFLKTEPLVEHIRNNAPTKLFSFL